MNILIKLVVVDQLLLVFRTFLLIGLCIPDLFVKDSGVDGLRNVRVQVPDAVQLGDRIRLVCRYDLDIDHGELLYTLKWYKDADEFYRYTPKEHLSIKTFPIHILPQFKVITEESNSSQVVLSNVTSRQISGKYTCEVTTDAPSFLALTASDEVQVVSLPTDLPQIKLRKPKYKVGDRLSITCISFDSKPAANLTWSINNKHVTNEAGYEKRSEVKINVDSGLETAESILTFTITDNHLHQHSGYFGKSNNSTMKIKCTASIYSIYQKVSEVSILFDRPPITNNNKYIYTPEIRQYPYEITPANTVLNNTTSQKPFTGSDNGANNKAAVFSVTPRNYFHNIIFIIMSFYCLG